MHACHTLTGITTFKQSKFHNTSRLHISARLIIKYRFRDTQEFKTSSLKPRTNGEVVDAAPALPFRYDCSTRQYSGTGLAELCFTLACRQCIQGDIVTVCVHPFCNLNLSVNVKIFHCGKDTFILKVIQRKQSIDTKDIIHRKGDWRFFWVIGLVAMVMTGTNIGRIGLHQARKLFWTRKKDKFGRYAIVKPGYVSPAHQVPDHIAKPPYYYDGEPQKAPQTPEIKSIEQIGKMRKSCTLAANILKAVENTIKVGMTTEEIDKFVHKLSIDNNAYPSPLNYRHYPKSVCTSVNNVACHGIPDDRPLEDGDTINVDITVWYDGYHGDCSKTFLIGDVDEQGRKLVEASKICLDEAILLCKPNERFSTIGTFIEKRAYEFGFFIVPCFLGHGIGSYFHGAPDIFHFTNNFRGTMAPGMTFTIEPILTQGCREIEIQEDNWTALTIDNARTSQFEHTILITGDSCEILTVPSGINE